MGNFQGPITHLQQRKNIVNKNLCILSQVYYNITFLTKISIKSIVVLHLNI
jgi:hypothetical protein